MDKKEILKYLHKIYESLLEIDLYGKINKDTRQQLSEDIVVIRKELGLPIRRSKG